MWLLLSKTKKGGLKIWGIFLVLVTGLTFLQTLTGQLAEMNILGWCWTGINLLPGFLILFISVLMDRESSKLITQFAHRMLLGLTTIYLLLLLSTLLAEPFATKGTLSMQEYRLRSFWWLLPYQLILIGGYYLLFFRKKPIFQPDQSAIIKMAGKEAIKWAEIQDSLRQECFQLIAKGKVETALEKLKENIDETGIGDPEKVILLQNQYNENRNNQRMNLISMDEWQRSQSRISLALMELLRQN
ncbi:MAG: hypothetical protein DHS20C18_10750 [Saprospiraceae bacterium]|nr:MAG: hypothetical protein DHS20C18_10750 [Saprospiraceae bacterium]